MTLRAADFVKCLKRLVKSWSTTVIVATTMSILNYILISEHKGNRRIGVTVLLIIADLSALTIIRLVSK